MTPWVAVTRVVALTARPLTQALAGHATRAMMRSEVAKLSKERSAAVNRTLEELEELRWNIRVRRSGGHE